MDSTDAEIKKFADAYQITFPVGKENGIAQLLRVNGIPTTVLVDKQGKIAKRFVGTVDDAELAANLDAMLK